SCPKHCRTAELSVRLHHLRRRGWTDGAKGAVVEVIDGEVDPEARDDARKGIGDGDPQLGVLNLVERLGILCDRELDGFEYLVYAASVGVELAASQPRRPGRAGSCAGDATPSRDPVRRRWPDQGRSPRQAWSGTHRAGVQGWTGPRLAWSRRR